ncbi:hypothetical protein, partial [Rhodococcus rhodochrous]|uniref:hypothetical protein n=1 Tax=Rhodococcus rhodochrous TaxID=1829 RepID=UPI0024BAFCDA
MTRPTPDKPGTPWVDTQDHRIKLSDYVVRLLDTEESRKDSFSGVVAVAKACYQAGIDEDGFSELVWQSALGAVFFTEEKCKTRGQFNKKCGNAWRYAEDSGSTSEERQHDVADKLASLLARVQSAPWPGRGGSSERAVAIALISYAVEINVYTVGVSVRTLVERSRLGFETTRKALGRLESKGLFTGSSQLAVALAPAGCDPT